MTGGEGVRTHSVGTVEVDDLTFFLRCRGCGARWEIGSDIGAQVAELERQPCGTREDQP